jgi:2'-5' RNA ligase
MNPHAMNTNVASRLFVALWPAPELQAELAAMARSLAEQSEGRPARAENIHLTLVFLGDVDPDREAALVAAIDAEGGRVPDPAFTLVLDRLGSFGSGIVWAGAGRTPPALMSLQARISRCAREAGIPVESRAFAAHLTLVRKARRRLRGPLGPLSWPVAQFRLVGSTLAEGGSRYRCIREWPLGDTAGSSPRGCAPRATGRAGSLHHSLHEPG